MIKKTADELIKEVTEPKIQVTVRKQPNIIYRLLVIAAQYGFLIFILLLIIKGIKWVWPF